MANRAYLWVVFTITLVCTVAAGAGLVYYYPRQETPQETPQETRVAAEPRRNRPHRSLNRLQYRSR